MDVTRRGLIGLSAFGIMALGLQAVACAEEAQKARVALRGYDTVNYFTDGRAEKGSEEFTASYEGVTYRFKDAGHRQLFVEDPEKYAPQFSGFCAIDLSRGLLTEADPEAWKIADGKLYVFGKPRGPGVFSADGQNIVAKASENWTGLRHRAAATQ